MNDASEIPIADILQAQAEPDAELVPASRLALYFAVGLGAGSVIALQIDVMRVFAVGSWAHFGSMVVSLAMLGFGLASAVMTVAKDWFARNWRWAATVSLALFGPLAVGANLYVQRLGFNAIFLVSDPAQKWRLLAIFLAELTPFLAGAFFLGCVFLRSNRIFGRVYFADLAGAGLCGVVVLLAMYVFTPANLIAAPLGLWFAACVAWSFGPGGRTTLLPFLFAGIVAFAGHFVLPQAFGLKTLATNDYKGVAYARKFPDAKKVYESASPFGLLEVYSSSYLHFAPGLSDNAGFNLPTMPANAYLGLYIDGDGPIGIMRDLTDKETAYFHYLPMVYPYVIKSAPKTFIVQFGGGISTEVALHSGAKEVTVAEGNRAVLEAFHSDVHPQVHRRHPVQGPRHRLRGPLFPGAHERALRRHRPQPRGFGRTLESRRLRHHREVLLHQGGDGDLYARAGAGRRAVGHSMEQGRAAKVGLEALCDDGGGGARGRPGAFR